VILTAANVHDSNRLQGTRGRRRADQTPERSPSRAPEDAARIPKGYDAKKCRATLRRRGIKSRIARRWIESSERLGRHRWVVERTLAWLDRYSRLAVRYERQADIHEAFFCIWAFR
jgi:transposase